jgi:hypothetical protein
LIVSPQPIEPSSHLALVHGLRNRIRTKGMLFGLVLFESQENDCVDC